MLAEDANVLPVFTPTPNTRWTWGSGDRGLTRDTLTFVSHVKRCPGSLKRTWVVS